MYRAVTSTILSAILEISRPRHHDGMQHRPSASSGPGVPGKGRDAARNQPPKAHESTEPMSSLNQEEAEEPDERRRPPAPAWQRILIGSGHNPSNRGEKGAVVKPGRGGGSTWS